MISAILTKYPKLFLFVTFMFVVVFIFVIVSEFAVPYYKEQVLRELPQSQSQQVVSIRQIKDPKIKLGKYNIQARVISAESECPKCLEGAECKPCFDRPSIGGVLLVSDNPEYTKSHIPPVNRFDNDALLILVGKYEPFEVNKNYIFSVELTKTGLVDQNPELRLIGYSKITKIDNSLLSEKTAEIKFSGVVNDFNEGCFADGVCSVLVDDKWVVTTFGGLKPPGSMEEERGENMLNYASTAEKRNLINRRVEVYAREIREEDAIYYSIYGSSDYYIKLIN